ncbi:MAG: type II secretion system protein M [Comamonadaceae bacterium]|nr:MAG: type II secretion system protein M [Comamonadaceae bacterium]
MSSLPSLGGKASSRVRPASSGKTAGVRAFWAGLATRERFMVGTALALVGLAVLWWVGISPALTTLRTADAEHRNLDAQLQAMRGMAAEAATLQTLPRIRPDDGRRALEASVKRLGPSAQMLMAGERATVTLKDTPPDLLADWLAQARSNARAVATEARLRLNAARTGWDGTVVLALPPP